MATIVAITAIKTIIASTANTGRILNLPLPQLRDARLFVSVLTPVSQAEAARSINLLSTFVIALNNFSPFISVQRLPDVLFEFLPGLGQNAADVIIPEPVFRRDLRG
jgi:hypothetical protein